MNKKTVTTSLLATVIAFSISQAYADAEKSPRIIGGTQATVGTYPWMVSLKDNSGQHFCGASLINKQWVMTAAHCVVGENANNISVVVGEYNTAQVDAGEQSSKVEKIIIHAGYKDASSSDNDIALLKLSSEINNKAVTPISPALMSGIKANTLLTVMGWGNMSTTGEEFPEKLHQVQVPLMPNAQCNIAYQGDITENMLCAGFTTGGKDSCQGDSGGPLLLQLNGSWQQVGIVSFGEGCASAKYAGVYTRVEKYNKWLSAQMGNTDPVNPTNPVDPVDVFDPSEMTVDIASLPEFIDFWAFDSEPETIFLTLENNSDQAVEIYNIDINQEAFMLNDNNCNRVVATGEQCKLNITYTPTIESSESEANMTIDFVDGTSSLIELWGIDLIGLDSEFDDGINWYADDNDWMQDENAFVFDSKQLKPNAYASLSAITHQEGVLNFDIEFENDNDRNSVRYYVDGKLVRTLKGSTRSSNHHSTQLSAGQHRITWIYKKKDSAGGNLKIKNIQLTHNKVAKNNNSGGGSSDLFFLSALLMLAGGFKRFC